jgi:hypothetical protein
MSLAKERVNLEMPLRRCRRGDFYFFYHAVCYGIGCSVAVIRGADIVYDHFGALFVPHYSFYYGVWYPNICLTKYTFLLRLDIMLKYPQDKNH